MERLRPHLLGAGFRRPQLHVGWTQNRTAVLARRLLPGARRRLLESLLVLLPLTEGREQQVEYV